MKFNINTTVFIKLDNLNDREIFSICAEYDLVFEKLTNCKKDNLSLYIDTKIKKVVATSKNNNVTFLTTDDVYYGGLTKKEHDAFTSIKPIKVPKLKVNEGSINLYRDANAKHNLRIDKFDRALNNFNNINIDSILEDLDIDNSKKERGITITFADNTLKRDISYYDIDTILEKITMYGIDSLTKDEKKFLNDNN